MSFGICLAPVRAASASTSGHAGLASLSSLSSLSCLSLLAPPTLLAHLARSTAALLLALAAVHAQGQVAMPLQGSPRADDLKRAYQTCSCEAHRRTLDSEEVMARSVIYERLKERAFDGDFARLLAWSRTQPLARCSQVATRPAPR